MSEMELEKRAERRSLRESRREVAAAMKNAGATYREVAIKLGMSAQGVHSLLRSSDWKPNAELKGKACMDCGVKGVMLHQHHEEYPDKIVLLCGSCHVKRHVEAWKISGIRHKCKLCGREWTQRGKSAPRVCPGCKRFEWANDGNAKPASVKPHIRHKCQREACGHEWTQRGKRAPKVCPVCKRFNWAEKP